MTLSHILITIFLLHYPLNVHPASTDKNLGVLKIGTMDLRPYGWSAENGQGHGIIFEMNNEIGKRIGVSYQNRIYPFKRMLKLLKEGEIDLISSQGHLEALRSGEKVAIQFNINVIAATKKNSTISTLDDFKGKHVIFHRSASYKKIEEQTDKIVRVNNYKQALRLLNGDRQVAGAVFSEPAYYYWMKELKLTPKDFGNTILLSDNKEQWVFVRKNLPIEMKQKIKTAVESIYKENYYEKLLQKYGKSTQ